MLFIIIAFKRKLSVSSHAPSVEGKTEKKLAFSTARVERGETGGGELRGRDRGRGGGVTGIKMK